MSKNTTGKTPYTKPLTVEELLAMPDQDIVYDDDNPRTTEAEWKNSFVSHSYQELRENIARRRGQQKAPTKVSTTVRFDTEVLAAFKGMGKGWQTQMNNALKEWLATHSTNH